MSPLRRFLSLTLTGWVVLAPAVLTVSCVSTTVPDKRVLQYLNQQGFGKRYVGNAQEQNYVTIGDSIQFVDTFNPEVRGSEVVDIDGTIVIPEAGTVFVAGMTRSELESYLTQKLSPYFVETDVKVLIRTGGGKVYYMLGEIRSVGIKQFRGDTTLFEAVLAAGPEPFTANLGRIQLIRADPRDPLILTLNMQRMLETGDSTFNVQIREYDIIYVPPTFLKQIADLISSILVPILSPLRAVLQSIFYFGGQSGGGGGRGRRVF
jgi:protein involved in polysaccharide export with SLBB domain